MMGPFKVCFLVVLLLYGLTHVTAEVVLCTVPYGVLTALVLYFAVCVLRVPAPYLYQVETIIGEDVWVDFDEDSGFHLKTVAHRGACLDAPENSLEAFKLCAEKGCRAVEFDVILTADDVPIVFHDRTLERIAGSAKRISRNLWDDLAGYDIAAKHPLREKFNSTSIPTLDQTITLLLSYNLRMFIDLKNSDRKMVSVILNLFEKFPDLYTNAVVSSFFPNLIYLIRRRNPKIVCSLAWRPGIFAYQSYNCRLGRYARRSTGFFKHKLLCAFDALHEFLLPRVTYYLLGISIILLHKDVISADTVLRWHQKGIRVIAWTVNAPAEKAHLSKILRITYMTDTLIGEANIHGSK